MRRWIAARLSPSLAEAILAGYRNLAEGRVFASTGDFKADMAAFDRKEADGWQ